MRVGYLCSDLGRGHGWATYASALLPALARHGVWPVIMAARNSLPLDGHEVHAVLPCVAPRSRGFVGRLALAAPRVRALLRGCDVVHTLAEPYAPLGGWLADGMRRPHMISAHGTYALPTGYDGLSRVLHGWAMRRAARVICVSAYTQDRVRAAWPEVSTGVVPNGVDATRFADLPPAPRDPAAPVILAVGALKPRKGALALVRALAAVRRSVAGARLVWAGDSAIAPGYAAQVRAEAAALGLPDDAVTLAGRVDEATLRAHYAAASVFALPSVAEGGGARFEGFGLVHLEASAAGLPTVGVRQSGASGAILDGVTGVLVDADDLDAQLAGALTHLLTNPDVAARMGAAGRVHARAQSWDAAARALVAHTAAVLARA